MSIASATDHDYIFKFLIIGDSAVGKSSLLLRFSDNYFNDAFLPTIGVDFKIKRFQVADKVAKLQIWDTAGQERFQTIISTYFKGAQGIFLVYDCTNKKSFQNIEYWLGEAEKHAKKDVSIMLLGNKCDLDENREVTTIEGQELAEKLGIGFLETSAKNKTNVESAFMKLTKELISKMHQIDQDNEKGGKTVGIRGKPLEKQKNKTCGIC
jgi:Ras-related protein Rab-1A